VRRTFVDQVPKKVEMLSMKEADWDACRSTLEGRSDHVTAVAFSLDGRLLHTNEGEILLSPSLVVLLPSWQQKQSCNILVQDQWILHNQQRSLWLPSEYRGATAVHEDIACLGCYSSRVVLIRIL
jgi:hypothetical protein